VFESYAYLSVLIHNKDISIARLRKILFGDSTESSANVLGTEQGGTKEAGASSASAAATDSVAASSLPDTTRRGHGRNGAQDLPGAKRVSVRIAELQPGAECPACGTGPFYELNEPGVLIRFVGNAPVRATIDELQKLRCQICGKVFTADPPSEAGSRKYDPTVGSLIGMLKYGYGFPFHRLAQMYAVDDRAKREQLTPAARLLLHQQLSGPVMEDLREWLKEQIEQRLVEPHSGLGAAIETMRRHWTKLTLFLRMPGAPLDNNVVERALKKAILHRKNALFFKTDRGAQVGDIHMSLIHSCELCDANPSDYLTALQQHATAVKAAPAEWLPWNYRDAIASLAASS
jgi:transposase